MISAGWGKSSQAAFSFVLRFFFTFAAFFRNLCYVFVTAASRTITINANNLKFPRPSKTKNVWTGRITSNSVKVQFVSEFPAPLDGYAR